jgi:hypothetical protein
LIHVFSEKETETEIKCIQRKLSRRKCKSFPAIKVRFQKQDVLKRACDEVYAKMSEVA